MNFSDLFDFGNRVRQNTVMVSDVNGVHDERLVKKGFNWLGALFMYFYVLFSEKYDIHGFGKKLVIIGFISEFLLGILTALIPIAGVILGVVVFIWIGLMFDTWFRNQLMIRGYTEKETAGFRTQQVALSGQSQQALQQPARDLMACPNCHEMIPSGIQFCTNCGANVAEVLQSQQKATEVECLNCHTMNPAGAKFCVSCGSDIQQLLVEQQKQVQQTTAEVTCPKCHTLNQVGAKFCVQCGFNFMTPTEKTCPNCQMQVPIDGKFCPGCGHAFAEQVVQQ